MAGSPDVLTGTFAGRYTIERELGSGATATVYLARDTQRGMSVAVKLLRPELSQSVGAERFLREIQLNERLHHPHIVPVLDSGEHEGRLYFVLPHMEEGSLRQLLQREKQLPIERAIETAKTVAQALDYAHQQNLIHRDVKPENILFTAGQACLADFGIARAVERAIDESTTDTGLVRGTPAYMSPEQASGSKHYDGRSDQYSLACVLYEMLAGVPAFIGPTPEAVIAQRFQHLPRQVRVYRSSVPEAIDGVLMKALAMAPADRFGSAAEFAATLDAAVRTPTAERPGGSTIRLKGPRRIALIGAVGIVGMLIALGVNGGLVGPLFGSRLADADSVRYAILPLEADSSLPVNEAYDRLHHAFAEWSGIELASRFDVEEAIGSPQRRITDESAAAAARRLRTGRYVRARLARAGSGFSLTAVLSDAISGRRLFEVSVPLEGGLVNSERTIGQLTSALLLRTTDSVGPTSKVLPAAQLYLQGMREQRAFRLDRADALLGEAVERDREFAPASLWLAQVRAWRLESSGIENWLPWAERAAASPALSSREQRQASALVALGRSQFEEACRTYRAMIASEPTLFEAWYGLGQCIDFDRAVVPDRRTASGWRFRSSYHQASRAYTRAFELAPSTHRNFEPQAFTQLRRLLYAGRALGRSGAALPPDTTRFTAYPAWSSDSLVFVPYPLSVVRSGRVPTDHAARARATTEQQRLFARIARSWSAAFPRNASAKEAVAVALEMGGDAAALDTLRLARSLAQSDDHRLRLAAEEVLFRVSLARRNIAVLREATRLADSLLAALPLPTVEQAQIISPLAALRGRCTVVSRLAAFTATRGFGDFADIPRSALASADSLSILVTLGCDTLRQRDLDEVVGSASVALRLDTTAVARLEYSMFARAYAIAGITDSIRLGRLSRVSADYLLTAQYDLARGASASVREMLALRERQRGAAGTADVTPDAVFPEARLWLALGDTVKAAAWTDPMLRRASWLEHLLNDSFAAASLMRTALLRAELARSTGDDVVAAQWNSFIRQLWSDSDRELAPLLRALSP